MTPPECWKAGFAP